uniref:Uncharacterized protein n=1 Tax=Spongospora subterranea TaxID=70186 RepID=A0A0H5QY34_9EUKA|eukprot:CRZ00494.1 hypothetical protein [Spongospora subterranea]
MSASACSKSAVLLRWINAFDLVIQLFCTISYTYAIRSFEFGVRSGAQYINDDVFIKRIETGFGSNAWSWLHIVPFMLLLTVIIHKTLWLLLSKNFNTVDALAFVFDSLCMISTYAWLLYWLNSSSLSQVAELIDNNAPSAINLLAFLHIWMVTLALMTISFTITVLADIQFMYKMRTSSNQSANLFISGKFQTLNVPLLAQDTKFSAV